MEALADPDRLGAPRLRSGVINDLHGQVAFVLVALGCPTVLGPTVGGAHTIQRDRVCLEERQHPIIQAIGGRTRRLSVLPLREPHLAGGVDDRLLRDAPDALERPHRAGVLGTTVARTFVRYCLLQCHDLGLGEYHPSWARRLHRRQPFPPRLQSVPEPDPPDARRGKRERLVAEFIGDPPVLPGRLFDRHWHNGRFHLRRHPILQQRLLSGALVEGGPPGLIALLEPIEAASAIPHQLTGVRAIAQWLRPFQHADFRPDDLLLVGHRPHSVREGEDAIGLSD